MSRVSRAYTGTIPALQGGIKIGPEDFTPIGDGKAEFIQARLQLWDELYAAQEERRQAAPKTPISIRLPNGDEKPGVSNETTPQMIAESILLKNCVVAKVKFLDESAQAEVAVADIEDISDCDSDATSTDDEEKDNSQLWDMNRPLPASCELRLLRFDDPDAKHAFWHSSAHLLGLACEHVFGAKLTIGPALQRGFYYDFYGGSSVTVKDEHYEQLKKAADMHTSGAGHKFERLEMSKQEALCLFGDNPFKVALIAAKVPEDGKTTAYRCGPFVDLCMGPHVPNLNMIKSFEIEKHSAAYWLADANGDVLQRVYGIAFPEEKMMKAHKKLMEEAKKRDHRNLGNQLGLFFFDPVFSPGCCFWTPLGARIYNKLVDLMRGEYIFRGFQEVHTPNLFSSELFKVSGHWANYKDDMFTLNVEGKEWALKPMNCPGHCCVFRHLQPSYKNLPIRLADFGVLHRNEFSGSLSGLTRVRRFQQDDAHIFCRMDQVKGEVGQALEFLFFIYRLFGFRFQLYLSTRPKKAMGTLDQWNNAEAQLKEALQACGLPWSINKGDGAFYGPKIDIQLFDALDRGHQCGTIQLDFQLPLRFDLQYKTAEIDVIGDKESADAVKVAKETAHTEAGAEGQGQTVAEGESEPVKQTMLKNPDGSMESPLRPGHARPVMVHRAILGSIERMSAVCIEHFGGKLPFWLSPRQAIVCPISEKFAGYAQYVRDVLHQRGFDVEADLSNTTIKKKIREAAVHQWNYILVVGASEEETRTVMVRCREDPDNQKKMTMTELVSHFQDLRDITKRQREDIPEYIPQVQG